MNQREEKTKLKFMFRLTFQKAMLKIAIQYYKINSDTCKNSKMSKTSYLISNTGCCKYFSCGSQSKFFVCKPSFK